MKTTIKPVGMVLALFVSTATMAQNAEQQYLSSDPININGYVQEELPPTDAELESIKGELNKQRNAIIVTKEKKKRYDQLSDSTEKLSEEMEDLISERKEAQEKIEKYNKKIDCLMGSNYKPGCEEYVKQEKKEPRHVVRDEVHRESAAPEVVVKVKPAAAKTGFGSEIKILPYTGLTTYMSDQNNLESNIGAGIKVESNLNERFSIGMGFSYTTMTTQDFGSGYFDPGFYNYYDSFYNGRTIEYSNMNFNLYSKFFILKNERFRPYIGAGIGYNRSKLSYANNDSASSSYGGYGYGAYNSGYYGYNFGNEEVVSSSVNVELMAGSEISITQMIGVNLELSYMRGLGSNLSTENGLNAYNAPDQQRLQDLSDELSSSNIVSLYAGMLVYF